MISTDEAFDLLVGACPSYFAADDLDRYVAKFEDADTPDLFVRTTAFAHHLVFLLGLGRPAEVEAVAGVLEQLLVDGDEDTVELAELGVIESLQNIVSHRDVEVGPDQVLALLGSSAAAVWVEHEKLWIDAGRWRHDGPRVEEADYDNIGDPDLRRYYQAHKRRLEDGVLISASDIVYYQTELANLSPILPAGRPSVPVARGHRGDPAGRGGGGGRHPLTGASLTVDPDRGPRTVSSAAWTGSSCRPRGSGRRCARWPWPGCPPSSRRAWRRPSPGSPGSRPPGPAGCRCGPASPPRR